MSDLDLLRHAADLPPGRVARLEIADQSYFVKSVEVRTKLRQRITKGDPAKAFAREVALLRAFAARGAPVPRIIAANATHLVLADHGTPVEKAIRKGHVSDALLRQIGTSLAALHKLGLAHGRPLLRDICYDGTTVTFLDLEAGAKLDARPYDQARDLIALIYSMVLATNSDMRMTQVLIDGYRSEGDPAVWDAVRKRSRNLWWLELLALPGVWLHRFRRKKRSEMAAVSATRALIATSHTMS